MNLTLFAIIFLFSITVTNCFSQSTAPFEPYNSSDYIEGKYALTRDTATFLNFKIEILQLHLNQHDSNTPDDFYCRGWLLVSEGTKVISQLYFPVLEPVGACYGLFIPESQPRKDCFLISCFHDYAAEIYVVDDSGKLKELNGGTFYVSNDNSFLFSHDGSDLPGLTVYDMNKKVILFSDSIGPHLADWYFINGKFIATIWNPETDKVETTQFAYFSTRKKELKILSNKKIENLESKKLRSYNDELPSDYCNCGQFVPSSNHSHE